MEKPRIFRWKSFQRLNLRSRIDRQRDRFERKTERKIQEEKEEDKKVEIRRKRIGLKRRKISRVVCSDDGAVNL